MSHFICLYPFPSSPDRFICAHKTRSWCFFCPSRPGVLKDLKSMGSISLFIFFITLLVLARQVSPNYNGLIDIFLRSGAFCTYISLTSLLTAYLLFSCLLNLGSVACFLPPLGLALDSFTLLSLLPACDNVDCIITSSCSHLTPAEGASNPVPSFTINDFSVDFDVSPSHAWSDASALHSSQSAFPLLKVWNGNAEKAPILTVSIRPYMHLHYHKARSVIAPSIHLPDGSKLCSADKPGWGSKASRLLCHTEQERHHETNLCAVVSQDRHGAEADHSQSYVCVTLPHNCKTILLWCEGQACF